MDLGKDLKKQIATGPAKAISPAWNRSTREVTSPRSDKRYETVLGIAVDGQIVLSSRRPVSATKGHQRMAVALGEGKRNRPALAL